MKSFIQKIPYIFGIGALVLAGVYFAWAQGSGLPNNDYDLYGYACNIIPPSGQPPIGCISLNKLSSIGQSGFSGQPTTSWRATYNPAGGVLGGKGWNPIIGEVEFGVQCPIGVNIPGAQTGLKCARITDIVGNTTAGAWDGYIYTGSITYIPPTSGTPTGAMFGVAWGANNIDTASAPYDPDIGVGRIDFSQYAFISIPGCMDPSKPNYNPYATLQDTSCSSSIEICTNIIDDNGNGTINEGCPEICGDGLDNNQDSSVDENPPCTGITTTWCNDGIDNDSDALIDNADSDECPTSGVIKPKYKER
jgi:hypothetical protein